MRTSMLLLLGLCGCAVSQPEIPMARFLDGDFAAVREFAAAEVEAGDAENLALVLNVQGQCDLLLGQPGVARRSFERAGQMMGTWATSGSETFAAIVGSESSKTWTGDPYEKCMNAFYLAFCCLLSGEPDNARAACKRGILADGESADEKFQADNALLFWFAGRMSALMGTGDGEDFFREARTANTFAKQHGARADAEVPALAEPTKGNLVLLFECGMGPEKYPDGSQDELARFRPRPHPAVRARVAVDGRPAGTSSILLDVDYQARTRGGTAMEGIRSGKAVFKEISTVAGIVLLDQALQNDADNRARRGDRGRRRGSSDSTAQTQAIVGGALLLAALLTSTAADVRHWSTLPSTVQVLALDVPPGAHDVVVEFLDSGGRPIGSLRQRTTAQVPASGEAWYLFRSLPAPRLPEAGGGGGSAP